MGVHVAVVGAAGDAAHRRDELRDQGVRKAEGVAELAAPGRRLGRVAQPLLPLLQEPVQRDAGHAGHGQAHALRPGGLLLSLLLLL